MNRCVFFTTTQYEDTVICTHEGPYMVNGYSFCREHVTDAVTRGIKGEARLKSGTFPQYIK
jgi:hypothetical protein